MREREREGISLINKTHVSFSVKKFAQLKASSLVISTLDFQKGALKYCEDLFESNQEKRNKS